MKQILEEINFTELEKKVLFELNREDISDFGFLYGDEVLAIAMNLLDKLLQEERNKFYKLLETKDEDISFSIFEDRDRLSLFFTYLTQFELVNSTEEIRNIISYFQPRYIEFGNEMAYSRRFYDIHVICRNKWWLDDDQRRILDLAIRSFERNWIHLPESKQNRLKEISQRLEKLSFDFDNNVLDSEKEFQYIFENTETIKDIPEDVLTHARELAKSEWIEGYKFLLDESSYINIMKYCSNENIRKHFYESMQNIASEWKHDNRNIILEILSLRQELANILWYSNYWEYALIDNMANNSEIILSQENIVTERAKIKAKKELEELKNYFWLKQINRWDVAYYSRILKEKKYFIDDKLVREYFEYDRVLQWMFDIFWKLFDLTFKQIKIKTYDENVKIFEIYRSWELISYYILDPFYRPLKKSWAFAWEIRNKEYIKWKTIIPIAVNVCNFLWTNSKVLLSHAQVRAMFHEFWHTLHWILCDSRYSQLAKSYVEHDFTEVPSQLMENWCNNEGLKQFAFHYKTWEVIPDEIIEKLSKIKTVFSWIPRLQWRNSNSKLDIYLHTNKIPEDINELDSIVFRIINEFNVFEAPNNYKPHTGFSHIFSWWYEVWFYSYLRSEIIEADIFEEFKKKWIFNKQVAQRYLETILSQWARKPAIELFRDFMWREPKLDAFFNRNWF